MGIHKFYGWFANNYGNQNPADYPFKRGKGPKYNPAKISNITPKKPTNVSCVFFDANSIFHNTAMEVYAYGKDEKLIKNPKERERYIERKKKIHSMDPEKLKEEHFGKIVRKIFEIINEVNPEDYAVIAVDGVAPMAKITQQRTRRYKKALDESKKDGPKNPFDSNCITPGTDFMFDLDSYIKRFFAENIKGGKFTVSQIVYSSHLVPGEGEHKIFSLLKEKKIVPSDSAVNIVYGADADLFMLSLLSDQQYLYLYREDTTRGNKDFINIDSFRRDLISNMTYGKSFDIPDKIVIQDFVVMLYTIGNDFLPHIIAFEDLEESINTLFFIYGELQLPLTDLNGQILWANFQEFMIMLARREQSLLEKVALKNFDYPFKTLDEASTKTIIPESIIAGTSVTEGESYTAEVNMPKFRKLWYEKCLSPKHPNAGELMNMFGIDNPVSKEASIREMCLEYFKGMQWVLRYYLFGHKAVTTRYIYVYHYAPLLQDLAKTLQESSLNELTRYQDISDDVKDPVITPVHQLMCVMPPASWHFIPTPWRILMDISLKDISPTSFDTDIEGNTEKSKYQEIAIISVVDPGRIVDQTNSTVGNFNITKKYAEVLTRFIKNAKNPKTPFVIQTIAQLEKYYKDLQVKEAQLDKERREAVDELKGLGTSQGDIKDAKIHKVSVELQMIDKEKVEDAEEILEEVIEEPKGAKKAKNKGQKDFPWQNAYLI